MAMNINTRNSRTVCSKHNSKQYFILMKTDLDLFLSRAEAFFSSSNADIDYFIYSLSNAYSQK